MPTDCGWRGSELLKVNQLMETMNPDEVTTERISLRLPATSTVEESDAEGPERDGIYTARSWGRTRYFRCYFASRKNTGGKTVPKGLVINTATKGMTLEFDDADPCGEA